jgi:hypothetical protein
LRPTSYVTLPVAEFKPLAMRDLTSINPELNGIRASVRKKTKNFFRTRINYLVKYFLVIGAKLEKILSLWERL